MRARDAREQEMRLGVRTCVLGLFLESGQNMRFFRAGLLTCRLRRLSFPEAVALQWMPFSAVSRQVACGPCGLQQRDCSGLSPDSLFITLRGEPGYGGKDTLSLRAVQESGGTFFRKPLPLLPESAATFAGKRLRFFPEGADRAQPAGQGAGPGCGGKRGLCGVRARRSAVCPLPRFAGDRSRRAGGRSGCCLRPAEGSPP